VFVRVYQPIIHIAWTYLLIHWKKRFQSAGKMDTLEKWLGALLGRSISSNSTTPKGLASRRSTFNSENFREQALKTAAGSH
jgi:hypothetical protein